MVKKQLVEFVQFAAQKCLKLVLNKLSQRPGGGFFPSRVFWFLMKVFAKIFVPVLKKVFDKVLATEPQA